MNCRSRPYRPMLVSLLACTLLLVMLGVAGFGCGNGSASVDGATYRLKLSHHIPPDAPPAKAIAEWTQRVSEATGGRVQIEVYASETLAEGREALQATAAGVCDIAMLNFAYVSKEWSLNSVISLGSLAIPSERGTEIWDQLLARFPEMAQEMSGVKVLGKSVATTTSLHVKDKEIRVPADLSDLKIAALGDSVFLVQAAGAISVNVSSADWETAAGKGLISGCMAPVYVVTDRGLETIFDHHLDLGVGAGAGVVVMNRRVWDSLPTDIQAALDGLTPWLCEAMRSASIEVEAEGWQKCQGQVVVKPDQAELELWKACFQPAAEEWIEENAGKGRSREIYEYLVTLTEQ